MTTDISIIRENISGILKELPEGVQLVAAVKTRTPDEIRAVIEAGVGLLGENYVQEAKAAYSVIGKDAKWHFIGHLQKNKVKKAVEIFDLIETVDSFDLAKEIDKRCLAADKVMSVLIEVNSGKESQKTGVLPEDVPGLIESIASFKNIKVRGLMTMGPFAGDPEDARPYFSQTRKVFEDLRERCIPGVEMKCLSMGMTNSYKVAIEEGANMVRIGTKIFGERE